MSFFTKTRDLISPECTERHSGGIVFKESLLYYLKYLIVSFAIIIAVLMLSDLLGLDIKNVNSWKGIGTEKAVNTLLLSAFLGPVLEECIFRLWISFRRGHIFISLFVIAYVILTKCLPNGHNVYIGTIQSDYFEFPLLKTLLSSAFASCIFLFKEEHLQRFFSKYGRAFILASVIVFALLHLTNMRCAWYIYPFLICMCLPQFVLGVSVTNLRLRIGFWAAVLFHCATNLITIFLSSGDKILEALKLL